MAYPYSTFSRTANGEVLPAARINELQSALEDLLTELGSNPSGNATDVTTRLSNAAAVNVVSDYNAPNDGTTDAYQEITAAIAGLPSTGGRLLFPAGTYLISSSILVDKPIWFIGEGKETTTIRLANVTNDSIIKYDNASAISGGIVEGFTLYGVSSQQSAGHGIELLRNITDLTIRECKIYSCKQDGINITPSTGTIKRIYIQNCWITTCLRHGIGIDATSAHVRFVSIENNDIELSSEQGIYIVSDQSTGSTRYIQINDNDIHDNKRHGIYLQGGRYVDISDNNIIDNGTSGGGGSYDGIYISKQGTTAKSSFISIDGNLIRNLGGNYQRYGLNVENDTTNFTDYLYVNYNIITNNLTGNINIPAGINQNGVVDGVHRISVPLTVEANSTAYFGILPVRRNMYVRAAGVSFFTRPASAAGTILLNLYYRDFSGGVDKPLLSSADYDLETIGEKRENDLTLTTALGRSPDAGDYIYATITSNNADATTGIGGVLSIEYTYRG